MTTETLTLGTVHLFGIQCGPLIRVTNDPDSPGFFVTLAEWTSLRATVDLLTAADRRHAEDRAEIERLRKRPTEMRHAVVRDAAYSSQRECHKAEAERYAIRARLESTREFFAKESESEDPMRREMAMLVRNVIEGVLNG